MRLEQGENESMTNKVGDQLKPKKSLDVLYKASSSCTVYQFMRDKSWIEDDE